MELSQNLKIAIDASIKAGNKILEIYNSDDFIIEYKPDESPLTLADRSSDEIIKNILKVSRIPVLSEEGDVLDYNKRKDLKYLWIVDPLDGTKEFIKKNDEFTVNIALIENSKPIIGVTYAPALNVLYFSEQNFGSYKLELNDFSQFNESFHKSLKLPIISNSTAFRVLTSRSHLSNNTLDYIKNLKTTYEKVVIYPKGSSLKFCLLAEGKADCYPRFSPCMEWDTAAGQIICKEAGYDIVDIETNLPIQYNRKKLTNNSFIAR